MKLLNELFRGVDASKGESHGWLVREFFSAFHELLYYLMRAFCGFFCFLLFNN